MSTANSTLSLAQSSKGKPIISSGEIGFPQIVSIGRKSSGITSEFTASTPGKLSNHDPLLPELLSEYADLFTDDLGCCKGVKAQIHLKEGAIPKFFKARPVPFAKRDQIGAEIDRLEKRGVLEKVMFSDWASPIVAVIKPSGAVRLCGDFKVSVNQQINIDSYPLPRQEELFASLGGGEEFTKIDLSEAYLQLELEEESQKLLTINTHKGLYKYKRLAFGVASAPAVFQRTMHQL